MTNIPDCEPFFRQMRTYVTLDEQTMEIVAANANTVKLPKKQLFLREGTHSDKVFFVTSGLARSYYTDFTGKTVTWSFHFNMPESVSRNLFAVDYRAFLTGAPSSVSIETLSTFEALVFSKSQVDYLIEYSAIYERWMRKLNEQAFMHMYDRAFTLLTMTATERYEKLLKNEAHLLQLFSNYYIASYLGIVPQSLSRIKSMH